MASTLHDGSQPTAPEPNVIKPETKPDAAADAGLESSDSSTSSRSSSEAGGGSHDGQPRPKLHKRHSSRTIIVSRDDPNIELEDEDYDEGDARAMSPRRSSEEVDKLEETARRSLIDQAKQLQASLLSIVDRVESVKNDHEKLEGGNKFLQSYIGELMQTSKITASGSSKGKGKARASK